MKRYSPCLNGNIEADMTEDKDGLWVEYTESEIARAEAVAEAIVTITETNARINAACNGPMLKPGEPIAKCNYLVEASNIIRMILTVCLLVGVYSETGKWTTICLFCIALVSEVQAHTARKIKTRGL